MSPIHAVGADGATGDELVTQAADAAQAVVEAIVAQTYATGQVAGSGWSNSNGWSVAVSVVCERSGDITAWLATSVGPSYIHRGVRVPDNVRLAVTDPVVGRELWDTACAAGGADPLEVLARHAELRDAAAPGSRVLALAASVPEGQVTDWAEVVHARAAVSVALRHQAGTAGSDP